MAMRNNRCCDNCVYSQLLRSDNIIQQGCVTITQKAGSRVCANNNNFKSISINNGVMQCSEYRGLENEQNRSRFNK